MFGRSDAGPHHFVIRAMASGSISRHKKAASVCTGRQRVVSMPGGLAVLTVFYSRAPCVIPTIRPAYPWATTLSVNVRATAAR